MEVDERTRRRLVVLLALAIVFLLARVFAGTVGAPPILEPAFYALAIGCLVGCVLVVLRGRVSSPSQ